MRVAVSWWKASENKDQFIRTENPSTEVLEVPARLPLTSIPPPMHIALSWPRLWILRTENFAQSQWHHLNSTSLFSISGHRHQGILRAHATGHHARLPGLSSPPDPHRPRACSNYQQGSTTMQDTTKTSYPIRLDSSTSTTRELTHCRRKVTACVHARYANRGFDQRLKAEESSLSAIVTGVSFPSDVFVCDADDCELDISGSNADTECLCQCHCRTKVPA